MCRCCAAGNGDTLDDEAEAASGDVPHAWKKKLAVGSWCYACGNIINIWGKHCSGVFGSLADYFPPGVV